MRRALSRIVLATVLTVAGGGVMAVQAQAATTTGAAQATAQRPVDPIPPPCNAANDGRLWKDPTTGRTYICEYWDGGWSWVLYIGQCGGSLQGVPAAVKFSC